MSIRMTDTEIWEEDWFIDLPNEYKLFFLFIKDKCDHSGMWRPNRRKFSMSVHGKTIHYSEFLDGVNKDPETNTIKKRIIVLDNGKWFVTRFISFQLGGKFRIKIGAHRGALKLLITNGVHPKDVPNMDWSGMESLEMEELRDLAYGKGLYYLSIGQVGGKVRDIDKDIDPVHKTIGKGGVGENQNNGQNTSFKLQAIYDKEWNQVDTREREFKGITESDFNEWKKFVDWVIENSFQDLFRAIFVTPSDFTILKNKHGFVEEKWLPVVKKMLSTGIKPEQNLYFRIQDYIKWVKSNPGSGAASMSSGSQSSDYEKMEKW